MEVEPSVDTEAFSLPPQAARDSSITRIRIIQISFFLNKISLFFGFVFLYLMVSSYPFHVKSKRHNNSTYIKSLQAQIDATKAETEAVRAELEFARAEAKAAKADAEATKAEAEAILAEAAALKAEAEALMAEAELHKSETTLGAKEMEKACRVTRHAFYWLYQREPPAMPGREKSFSGKQRNKKNPSIEQKWFADHTTTVERDSS